MLGVSRVQQRLMMSLPNPYVNKGKRLTQTGLVRQGFSLSDQPHQALFPISKPFLIQPPTSVLLGHFQPQHLRAIPVDIPSYDVVLPPCYTRHGLLFSYTEGGWAGWRSAKPSVFLKRTLPSLPSPVPLQSTDPDKNLWRQS